jgi:drug/metabolite transporter (DMT)-like permease
VQFSAHDSSFVNISRHRIAFCSLLAATLVWGGTFVVAKSLLNSDAPAPLSPFRYIGLRFGAATLLMIAFWGGRLRGLSAQTLRHGFWLGVIVGAGYLLQAIGLASGSPSKAAFITGLSVPLVPIIGGALRMTRLTRGNVIGMILAFLGFCLLCRPGGGFGSHDLATLGCAVLFAFHILFTERFVRTSDSTVLNILQLGVAAGLAGGVWATANLLHSSGVALPSQLVAETRSDDVTPRQFLHLAYLVIFATILCYQAQTYAQRKIFATQTALILTLEPVFAAVIAFFVIGESIGLHEALGGGLIIAGVFLAEILALSGQRTSTAPSD